MAIEGAFGEPLPLPVKGVCPRCLKPWIRWARSRLLCHARCVFTVRECEVLYEWMSQLKLSEQKAAELLGIKKNELRAITGPIRKNWRYAGKAA